MMGPANTDNYMIAGYVVSFVTMGLYLLSMYIRTRNLKRDLETYESMDNEKK
ncbi:MAG: hypothetical protein KDD74_17650 [Anaerolineales bacterium]|nr:hypothetical protein [Anaerolineales bacterium]